MLSQGSSVVTLAPSGFTGTTTSFAGSTYTIATGTLSAKSGAAALNAWSPSGPLVGGLVTVLLALLLGAYVVV